MSSYEFHPIADLFPLIEGEEFEALCKDIKKNGLRQNIMIFEGKILDGRNRYRACKAVGEDIRTIEFYGDEPYEYVTAQNLLRRHISPQGRAFIAAQMANMRQGHRSDLEPSANWRKVDEPQSPSNNEGENRANRSTEPTPSASTQSAATSQAQAAELLNVPLRTVQRAAQIIQKGAPELVAAVRSEGVSISAAADVAMLPKQEQAEIIAKGPKAIKEAAKEVRASKSDKPAAVKPQRLSMLPADILMRTWASSSSFQRQRFLRYAEPSVIGEIESMERMQR